ncbi:MULTISPECIES: hypothetical protein [Salipiger]|uniref:hypothetical protein n=1 Tax=Salipiger TaxID=263377 RepID=UPI003519619A
MTVSAVETAIEETTASAGATPVTANSGSEETASAAAKSSERSGAANSKADASSGATGTAAARETASEDDLAAARAEAIATQESFKKSLLVASMSSETGESAPELGATPSRGAASYAAARDAEAEAPSGRSIAA